MRPIFKEGLLILSLLIFIVISIIILVDGEETKSVKATEAVSAVLFQADDKQNQQIITTTTTTIPPTTTTTKAYIPPTPVQKTPPINGWSVNWDAIAQCESGGNWSINTGNGYYGGLQFNLQTWRGVGGTGYPHEHTKEEQIYRAELLYSSRGVAPWPVCGKYG